MTTTLQNPPAKRKKKPAPMAVVISSEAAMLGFLNEWTETHAILAAKDAEHKKTIAALNSHHDQACQVERERLGVLEASLHLYVTTHRLELFPDPNGAKSKAYQNAVIGFRTNPPSVAPMLKGDTEKMIAERLADTEWGGVYMDWLPKLNKDALLRDRESLTAEQRGEVGITFSQEEVFFIKSNVDPDTRTTSNAEAAA